jgi:hypothetical protein
LFGGLQRYGWPVICIDARHLAAALQAGFRNKSGRNYRHAHALNLLLVCGTVPKLARAVPQSQLVALENTL